jgi:hypothetical protein
VHVLLEVPPLPAGGLSDGELLRRLRCIYNEPFVAEVAKRLKEYREPGGGELARELHEGFSYRMHDLSEFMKGFMQRFTQWYNRSTKRSGGLWEDVFKTGILGLNAAFFLISPGFQPFSNFVAVATSPVS